MIRSSGLVLVPLKVEGVGDEMSEEVYVGAAGGATGAKTHPVSVTSSFKQTQLRIFVLRIAPPFHRSTRIDEDISDSL